MCDTGDKKPEAEGGEQSKVRSHDGDTDATPLMTCQKCGLQRPVMDKCGSCLHVTYCSRDCQRADWKTHKVTCCPGVKVNAHSATHAQQKEPGKTKKNKGRAPQRGQQKSSSLSSALSKVTLTSDPTSDDLSWEEARARAGELFPGHRIVDTFGQLRSDMMGMVKKEKLVAVAKMEGVYPSFGRHGRCLKDAEGRSSFVLFHTADNPRPHFRYDQLRDGNFLCFQHAFMHLFADGTVGFRINEAREVRILEPTKQAKKKELASAPVTSRATEDQWPEARAQAKALFPDQRVVDNLQDLDQSTMMRYFSMDHVVAPGHLLKDEFEPWEKGEVKATSLLLLLDSPLSHSLSHGWVAKDSKGKNAQLTFELSRDLLESPPSHFSVAGLQKGRFVCISVPFVTIDMDCYAVSVKDASKVGIITL